MNKVIISDASCLIALDEIGQIEILKSVFSQIVTTQEVSAEFGKELPTWISIKTLQNSAKRNELELVLDAGEASAIALALENPKQSILIIDEKKGERLQSTTTWKL
jgi:predicted nucleic acid-binding protein